MKETAKDILDKNAPLWDGDDFVPRNQALAAMREIADKAWDGAKSRYLHGSISREQFMKDLFPETKTPPSET